MVLGLFDLNDMDIFWVAMAVIGVTGIVMGAKVKMHQAERNIGSVACGGCGNMNPAGSKFCNQCGTRFAPPQQGGGHPGGV
jgi:hypothetical protein